MHNNSEWKFPSIGVRSLFVFPIKRPRVVPTVPISVESSSSTSTNQYLVWYESSSSTWTKEDSCRQKMIFGRVFKCEHNVFFLKDPRGFGYLCELSPLTKKVPIPPFPFNTPSDCPCRTFIEYSNSLTLYVQNEHSLNLIGHLNTH